MSKIGTCVPSKTTFLILGCHWLHQMNNICRNMKFAHSEKYLVVYLDLFQQTEHYILVTVFQAE